MLLIDFIYTSFLSLLPTLTKKYARIAQHAGSMSIGTAIDHHEWDSQIVLLFSINLAS